MLRVSRRIASKNSSLSRIMADRSALVEAGDDSFRCERRRPVSGSSSHCPVKFCTNAADLGSASIRRTCGVEVLPRTPPGSRGRTARRRACCSRGSTIAAKRSSPIRRSGSSSRARGWSDSARRGTGSRARRGPPSRRQADPILEPLALALRLVVKLQTAIHFLGLDSGGGRPDWRTGRPFRERPLAIGQVGTGGRSDPFVGLGHTRGQGGCRGHPPAQCYGPPSIMVDAGAGIDRLRFDAVPREAGLRAFGAPRQASAARCTG